MRPHLPITEFVDDITQTSEPLVEAVSLLCGDKGLVLLLLNHDHQHSWPKNEMYMGKPSFVESKPDPITVTVNVPAPLKPSQVIEIQGKATSSVPFEFRDAKLSFVVNGIETTRQYAVPSQFAVIPKDWRFSFPIKIAQRIPGPDVQFEEKQYFGGSVLPWDEEVSHGFICRDVVTEPLLLEVDKYPSILTVGLPKKPIPPGNTADVKISCV